MTPEQMLIANFALNLLTALCVAVAVVLGWLVSLRSLAELRGIRNEARATAAALDAANLRAMGEAERRAASTPPRPPPGEQWP